MSFWLLLLFSLACFAVMAGVWSFSKQNTADHMKKTEKPRPDPKAMADEQTRKIIEMVAAAGAKMEPDSKGATRFFRIACEADTKVFAKSISLWLAETDKGRLDK